MLYFRAIIKTENQKEDGTAELLQYQSYRRRQYAGYDEQLPSDHEYVQYISAATDVYCAAELQHRHYMGAGYRGRESVPVTAQQQRSVDGQRK